MAGRNATVGLSSLRETLKGADYSIQGGGSFWSSDNVYSNNREAIVISNSMVLDCIEPSLGGATTLPENGAKQRSLNVTNSVEEYEGISCTKMKKSTALEFSRVFATDIESKDIPNSAASLGITLDISFKEPNNEAVSCFRSLDVDLKGPCHSKDGTGALHENSSLDGCFEGNALVRNDFDNGSGANPSQSRKRRRVSALDPSLSSLATSQTNKESAISYTSTLEEPLNANDASSYIKKEVNIFRTNGNNRGTVLAENKLAEGFSDALNAVSRSTSSDDNLEFEPHGVGSISTHDVLTTSLPLFSSGPGSEQRTDGTQVTFVDNRQVGILNVECSRKNNFGVSAPIERDVIHGETTECLVHSDLQPPNVDVGMEHNNLLEKDNLSHLSNYLSLPASCEGVSSTTTNEKKEFEPNMIPEMGTSQASFNALDAHMLDAKALLCQMSTELCRNDEKLDEKSVVEVYSKKPFSRSTEANLKSDHAVTSDHSTFRRTVALPLQGSKGASHSLNIRSAEYIGLQKNQLACIIPRTFTSCPAFVFMEKTPSVHAKPRTWHRDGNFSSPFPHTGSKLPSSLTSLRHIPRKDRKCQTNSYVRKGNSLVRNSLVAALHPGYDGSTSVKLLNSTRVDEMKRSTGSDNRVDACTKLSSSSALLSGDFMSSLSAERLVSGYCGSFPDSTRFSENNDTFKFAEVSLEASESVKTLNEQLNCSDSHTELNDANLASSDTKRIEYVKRKSNQLVATSDSHDISLANAEKMQASSFDGYYKKRKNQLIRTSFESLNKQIVIVPNDNTKSEVQKATSDRRGSRTQLEIVPPKLGKPATKTLVWTLRGTKSSANDHSSLRHQRGFPRLFPWKRTTFWKNFTQYRNLISEATSLSPITKLLLLRKRDTIYIRSTNGYSLRKSKVLSVGGSSLKWSKFIEKRAKQANEEATLAVAAAKRKKRENNGVAFAGSGLKNRKLSSRERIFRIGSDRYKMDPSRRTLQRISDNESSDSASVQTDKVARRSYIPRRLVIGNDEYVQVGNGNQLIRDPKRRTRLLASEKVRSSLHTVRLRLARKRKYCQFFPRFGKCNKDDGKCPYIHDPSKIAVCTKYLNSLCSNPNCKLTHKVIPERMPDCSYFLQGLCTNESCPYRHVNVNPKASICEGFLRGYCADGNECRKKHSYVCPTFQATRTCSQGSKCKLHHPMNRTGGKIRKRYIEPKNTRGRYFGSMRTNIAESRTSASDRQSSEDRSERCLEEGSDFISIDMDVSDDEEGESKDLMGKQTLVLESDPSKLQLDDRDELIKPVRIMH